MSLQVILTPAAQLDLAEAIEWYESLQPDLSLGLRLALDATLEADIRHPDVWAIVEPGVRRGLLRRYPYAIYYRQQPSCIEVIAILHTSRHPRKWQERSH